MRRISGILATRGRREMRHGFDVTPTPRLSAKLTEVYMARKSEACVIRSQRVSSLVDVQKRLSYCT
jgi:hypothetical protein